MYENTYLETYIFTQESCPRLDDCNRFFLNNHKNCFIVKRFIGCVSQHA